MTMRRVAQLAGVSTSTVSRVINDRRNVAPETVAAVRRIMRQLSVTPTPRLRSRSFVPGQTTRAATITFLVFGTTGAHPAPAFDRLLRGVSDASSQHDLSLTFSFVSDPSDLGQLPRSVIERRVAGLLLHGEQPSPAVRQRLQTLPTVWLMANRQRPEWGDQVMPDNITIGELAAQYLIRRGHRRLAYLGTGTDAWFLGVRSLAFVKTAGEFCAEACVLHAHEDRRGHDLWHGVGLLITARTLIDKLMAIDPMPTGLFVAEDRLLPAIDTALSERGLKAGPGEQLELISCNNERPHLTGLSCVPATIDIRTQSIGRRGVEQLVWRLRHADGAAAAERIRSMVEPLLIEPGADPTAALEDGQVLAANGNVSREFAAVLG